MARCNQLTSLSFKGLMFSGHCDAAGFLHCLWHDGVAAVAIVRMHDLCVSVCP